MAKITEEWVNGDKESGETLNSRWWITNEKGQVHKNLIPLVSSIEKRQLYRKIRNIRNARLYSNLEDMGYQTSIYTRNSQDMLARPRVSLNVVKSCIDTSASKIAKMKPRPMFLTSGGDWSQQQRAKKLTAYFEGLFQYTMPIYPEKQRSFVDAGVFGTGATKFYSEDGKPMCERTLIDELLIDDAEAIYGKPLQMHQIRYMNRQVLLDMFPKNEAAIGRAKGGVSDIPNSPSASDMLKVVESWKLPSREGAGDGRHVIVIDGADLLDEKWKRGYFPFVFDRWAPNLTGFFGMGIAEEITGIQLELNKIMKTIQIAQHFACVPRVFVENSSMVNTAHLNTTIGGVAKFTGTPPIFSTASAMPPEIYQHAENLYRKAFEITGVSQLAAQSVKPAGLNSGAALREYQDIESERFQLVGQRYEESFIDATGICIDLIEDAGGKLTVSADIGKAQQRLDWSEVKMDRKDYKLRVFPTSILPSQPSGKLQTIQELTQAGFIDKDMATSLLDFPDLEGALSMKNAAVDLVKKQITLMLDTGEPQVPEPYQNLPLAKQMAQYAYMQAKMDGADDDALDLVRVYIADCEALLEKAQMEAQARAQGMQSPGMPADAAPQAVPQAPPVSDLLANAPGAA